MLADLDEKVTAHTLYSRLIHYIQSSCLNSSVEKSKSSRSYFLFSTWGRKISSEESNETSEESKRLHVENVFSLRGYLRIATWISDFFRWRGGECGEELRSLCYPLQHFDDSLVLMVYDALLDR